MPGRFCDCQSPEAARNFSRVNNRGAGLARLRPANVSGAFRQSDAICSACNNCSMVRRLANVLYPEPIASEATEYHMYACNELSGSRCDPLCWS